MTDWIPKRRSRFPGSPGSSASTATPPDDLGRDERFLLQRVDGNLSVEDLSGLTGIEAPRVEAILQRLVAHGAVDEPLPHVVAQRISDDEARHLPELEFVDEPEDEPEEETGQYRRLTPQEERARQEFERALVAADQAAEKTRQAAVAEERRLAEIAAIIQRARDAEAAREAAAAQAAEDAEIAVGRRLAEAARAQEAARLAEANHHAGSEVEDAPMDELEELGPAEEDEPYDENDIPLAMPAYASKDRLTDAMLANDTLTSLPDSADSDHDGDDVPPPEDTQPMDTRAGEGDGGDASESADGSDETDGGDKHDDVATSQQAGDLRRLYMSTFRDMPTEQRIAATGRETGPRLMSFAFDAEPAVIRALFENTEAGPPVARLAAFHHRNAQGLEFLASHTSLLRDPQVQRSLLRNPQLGESLARRILAPRRLVDIYKVSLDRDIGDRTRATARTALRLKFTSSGAEERFALIWATEARVLQTLIGCTLDSRTTATICGKPVTSVMLVQNFARWGATPPAILAHFLKQNFVRRQAPLKKLLLQHPNCPSDAKKSS